MSDEVLPQADARSLTFYVSFEDGSALAMSYTALVLQTEQWARNPAVAPTVAQLLATARATYTFGVLSYESFTVACTWVMLAVEVALRERLGARPGMSMKDMLGVARTRGLVDEETWERLEGGRALRNDLVHEPPSVSWNPTIARLVMAAGHAHIASLYGQSEPTPYDEGKRSE